MKLFRFLLFIFLVFGMRNVLWSQSTVPTFDMPEPPPQQQTKPTLNNDSTKHQMPVFEMTDVHQDSLLPPIDSSSRVAFKNDTLPTTKAARNHSPKLALLFSAVLPGLGQAYNHKYWKIPIIYAGIGGLGYLIYFENAKYVNFRNAYILQVDGNPLTHGSAEGRTDVGSLETLKNYYKRNRDMAASFLAVWYALNLVDATVDGHLFKFDVSDKLSFHWQPQAGWLAGNNYGSPSLYAGIKFDIKL